MTDEEKYIAEITKKYKSAVSKVVSKIAKNFAETLPEDTYQEVVEKVLYIIYSNWKASFIDKIDSTVKKWTKFLYKKYRKDSSVLAGLEKIPKVSYSLSDYRAIEFFKDSDNFYLGRFITDESTTRKITEYIKKEYLENGGEIGRSDKMIEKFKENFAGVLDGEDWKIRRVLDTTVSRMRVTGALHYMEQAEVTEYEIVEVMDSHTCAFCTHMNGKRFSVAESYSKVENLNFGDGSILKEQFPFVTSVFKKPEDMDGLSASELSARGISMPPYHPSCRGTIVAVL